MLTDAEACLAGLGHGARPGHPAGCLPTRWTGCASPPVRWDRRCEAACDYARATGGRAGIGSLEDAVAIIAGPRGHAHLHRASRGSSTGLRCSISPSRWSTGTSSPPSSACSSSRRSTGPRVCSTCGRSDRNCPQSSPDVYDAEAYRRSQEYTRVNTRFHFVGERVRPRRAARVLVRRRLRLARRGRAELGTRSDLDRAASFFVILACPRHLGPPLQHLGGVRHRGALRLQPHVATAPSSSTC